MLAAYFSNTNKVLNDLDLGQDQPFVGPALSPNCLHCLSCSRGQKLLLARKELWTELNKNQTLNFFSADFFQFSKTSGWLGDTPKKLPTALATADILSWLDVLKKEKSHDVLKLQIAFTYRSAKTPRQTG